MAAFSILREALPTASESSRRICVCSCHAFIAVISLANAGEVTDPAGSQGMSEWASKRIYDELIDARAISLGLNWDTPLGEEAEEVSGVFLIPLPLPLGAMEGVFAAKEALAGLAKRCDETGAVAPPFGLADWAEPAGSTPLTLATENFELEATAASLPGDFALAEEAELGSLPEAVS